MRSDLRFKGALRAFFFACGLSLTVAGFAQQAGWGIDACLTAHVDAPTREKYLALLAGARIRVLRERGPNPALAELKARDHTVVAFTALPNQPKIAQPGNVLPENLLEVFAGGRELARQYAGVVDAWEMVGEPDVGYCRDLPDRVAAYQKALYLGLKAETDRGSTTVPPPVVLMGALALPPGPWLARATANGLLDYTDAYNFHFYGEADDLAGVIAAHRRAAGRGRPLWITECGIKTLRDAAEDNPARRALQAEFTAKTAEQAWRARDVALFMPFILVEKNDPFALTLAPDRLLPAWDAYANFVRDHPWPNRPLANPPAAPNPVVVQWLPQNESCEPHKVSGTYRFRAAGEIRGEVKIYNFSPAPVRGRLAVEGLRSLHVTMPEVGEITVPPMSAQSVVVSFSRPPTAGYRREPCRVSFREASRRESRAVFELETTPRSEDFALKPLELERVGDASRHRMFPDDALTFRGEHWLGTNGVTAEEVDGVATRVRLAMDRLEADPQRSRLAIARVRGLPSRGFIRLALDRPMDRDFALCVDLLDRKGQRFTVWENFGVDYAHREAKEVWLSLEDFHPYFWGRCTGDPVLRPREIEEIQLRLYVAKVHDPRTVELTFAAPR